MIQGQGKHTEHKIAGFEAVLKQNIAVVRYGIKENKYFHFDCNAGSGFNAAVNCEGSPLAFRRAARQAGMGNALSFCCEKNEGAAMELQRRTSADADTYTILGRNQDFTLMIPDIIRQFGVDPAYAYGSILLDPNDHKADAIPYRELREITEICPRLDVLFNFPQLATKRILASVAGGHMNSQSAIDCVDIEDMRDVINKKHLWIKQTPQMGNFALIVGRNTNNISKDLKTGLVEWDSDQGIYYRNRCSLPVDEAEARYQEKLEIKSGQMQLF